jgi:hypothetical protein
MGCTQIVTVLHYLSSLSERCVRRYGEGKKGIHFFLSHATESNARMSGSGIDVSLEFVPTFEGERAVETPKDRSCFIVNEAMHRMLLFHMFVKCLKDVAFEFTTPKAIELDTWGKNQMFWFFGMDCIV